MRLHTLVTAAIGTLSVTAPAHTQISAPTTYDVSTVKPAAPGKAGMMLDWDHPELKAENATWNG